MTLMWGFIAVVVALIAMIGWYGPNRIVDNVEAILAYVSRSIKMSLADYVDVENVDLGDNYTFVMKDGSLLTIIRHDGSMRMVGKQEFESADAAINGALSAYLGSGGHAFQVVFTVDPEVTERVAREAQAGSRATAERLGLAFDDLFEEDIRQTVDSCNHESCFIALFTRPSALSGSDRKHDQKLRQELMKANPLPSMADSPNLFRALRSLRARHEAYVEAVVADLREQRLDCYKLDTHVAAREMRLSIDPEWTAEDWAPCLFGDKVPLRDIRRDPEDVSGAVWPELAPQLAPRDAEVVSLRHVKIGDRYYAPMFVHLAPQDIQTFQRLFAKTAETDLPWRFSMLLESGDGGLWDFKNLGAMIFGWTNSVNAQIRRAIEAVRDAEVNNGRTRVRLRMDLCTWASDIKTLERRASQLARAVESWGTSEVKEISGDPVQGFVSSSLGVSLSSVATPSLALLDDVTHFLPLYRPSSPWKSGALLFKSPDGKMWPYAHHSRQQESCITVAYAEPRSGKSVLCNAINLSLCLSEGISRLPLISVIDVGRSSAGLISLLEHALPPTERHKVALVRMRMTSEFAINPCDTQLGMRMPLESEFAFLLNFLLTLVTPHGASKPDSAMSPLCRMAVEAAFRKCSDTGQPKTYSPNIVGAEDVDAALSNHALHVDDNTTWWEVVDSLFKVGAIREAYLAQRFAVPLLSDIVAVSREPKFQDMYGSKKMDSGDEYVLQGFSRMLSESVSAYPVLGRPTKFDLGEARVVAIDLADVAKSGSAAADHQTAVCYMLARQASSKNFYLHEDDLPHFPALYRNYQERRIKEIRQDKKHIQYDEFHRTKKVANVQEQVIADMREGGKYGVAISLISQQITDFSKEMLNFTTCKFVLSKANESTVKDMNDIFGLTKTMEFNVKNTIRPPGPQGSTFVGIFDVKNGQVSQALRNKMGGIRLWAFSTTNEDAIVRDELYQKIGPEHTRRLLAIHYPKGSVLEEFERRKSRLGKDGEADGVLNSIIEDLMKLHYEERAQEAKAA
ncbi:type IV secretion protein IcmB [Xanthomonas citri]|uniref:type IV secretion protein IcmB n=1 Tax=Xanthomonas citri TaxID=346 RepID=UPI0018DE20B4|nr:type IV secretion protein IcmB [Xanthomonas citri]